MKLTINALTINVAVQGSGHPFLLLHGFTGSAASWQPHMLRFGARRRVIAPDLIGHGHTAAPADPDRYRMDHCVADLLGLLDALDVEQTDVLGYSMGGRVALHLAAAAPQRVRRLVLESASPGLADPAERALRRQDDADLAAALEREGIVAFVDRWERMPLFASQANLPASVQSQLRAQRLKNCPTGLANSLRGMGAGQQEPLWEWLATIPMPTLLLVGELDQKYCAIARRMVTLLPQARVVVVPDAGHTIHLEQPDSFAHTVLEFLDSAPGMIWI